MTMKFIGMWRYNNNTFDADVIDVISINKNEIVFRWRDKEKISKSKIQSSARCGYFFISRGIRIYINQIQTEDGKLLLAQ